MFKLSIGANFVDKVVGSDVINGYDSRWDVTVVVEPSAGASEPLRDIAAPRS